MTFKEFRNKIKAKAEEYFDIKITRIMTIIIMLLAITSLAIDGIGTTVYVECPENSNSECMNPLILCNESVFVYCSKDYINSQHKQFCKDGLCTRYLQPGDTVGKKPSWLSMNLFELVTTILIIGLFMNHLSYLKRDAEKKKALIESKEASNGKEK